MVFIIAALNALAALPGLIGLVESFASAVSLWYCQRATQNTLEAIADAASLAANAKTEEDRFSAAEAWQKALSRPKEING